MHFLSATSNMHSYAWFYELLSSRVKCFTYVFVKTIYMLIKVLWFPPFSLPCNSEDLGFFNLSSLISWFSCSLHVSHLHFYVWCQTTTADNYWKPIFLKVDMGAVYIQTIRGRRRIIYILDFQTLIQEQVQQKSSQRWLSLITANVFHKCSWTRARVYARSSRCNVGHRSEGLWWR